LTIIPRHKSDGCRKGAWRNLSAKWSS